MDHFSYKKTTVQTLSRLRMIVLALLFFFLPFRTEASDLTRDIKILFTSDVHCAIDQG